jgi:hypothetical protein
LSKEGTSSWIEPILPYLVVLNKLSLQILNKNEIKIIQRIEKNGEFQLKKSSMTWLARKWETIKNKDIPKGRPIKYKRIFKMKRSGVLE